MAELSHFDLDGDLLEIVDEAARKNVDALQKEQEELKELCDSEKILSNAITETTSTTQPNSYAGREHILEIGGVMEQDSTEGNQLWNADSLIGVASKEYDSFFEIATLTEGTYTIYIEYAGGTAGSTVYFYGDGGTTIKSLTSGTAKMNVTFTAEEASKIVTATIFPYSANVGKAYKTVMFNKGDAVLSQEKFSGGQPAPNPSYQMEIKNSVVSGIRTHHKNFLKITKESNTINGITFTVNKDGTVLVNGTATALVDFYLLGSIPFHDDLGEYILSGCPSGGAYNTYCLYANNGIGYISDSGNGSPKFKMDGKYYTSFIRINSGVTVSNLVFKPMIRKADVEDSTFELYQGTEITFSQPIESYGMNGVQDVLTAKQTKRRFVKYVLDGSDDENWTKEAGFDYVFRHRHGFPNAIAYSPNQLCTHLLRANTYNEVTAKEGYFVISSSSIIVNVSGITTSPDLRSFLAENPMTFVFDLSEETTEALPIADQIALNSLPTYGGITYVEFIYEGPQPTFKGEYGTSKVGGVATEALGKANTSVAHPNDKSNPHNVTKEQLGLGNVDNTSDANKPVSTAQKEYVDAHTGKKDNPHGVTKEQIGLDKVENKTSAEILGELTKEDIEALKVLAAAVRSLNADGSMMCSISDGLAKFFKGDTVQGAIGVNQVTTNGQTYTTFNIRGYEDLMAFSFEGNSNARYYMNPKNIPLTDAQYTEPHHFKGDMRVVGDVKATGGMWSNEFNINKLGLSGGAAQPVEWVWHGELQRWVLCTITE